MKKSAKRTAFIIAILIVIVIAIQLWGHYHPKQDSVKNKSSVMIVDIDYPDTVKNGKKSSAQMDALNQGLDKAAEELADKYPKNLSYGYDLDRDEDGEVTAIISGRGTTKDGKKEEFREVLKFPLPAE